MTVSKAELELAIDRMKTWPAADRELVVRDLEQLPELERDALILLIGELDARPVDGYISKPATPASLRLRCSLCNRELDDPREAWRESAGWVSPRGAKGMTGAHQTGRLACSTCITAIRAGVAPTQTELEPRS